MSEIMKILPLSIQLMPKTKLNNNTVSNPVINHGLKKDTVSFGSSFVQEAFDNLNETVDKQIMPFLKDNQSIYQSLIDINKDISSVMNKFSVEELNLMEKKADLITHDRNEKLSKYRPYISQYYKYQFNLREFTRLNKIVSDKTYNNDEIKQAVKNAQNLLFENNPELNKLKPLAHKYEDTLVNISLFNDKRTLSHSDLPLKNKFSNLADQLYKTSAYAFLMPMKETFMLLRSKNEAAKELAHPTQSMMKTLSDIEHMQMSADSIFKNIKTYEKNKDEIINFVENYNKNKVNNPSDKEIKKTYAYLAKVCKQNAMKEYQQLDDYYRTQFTEKNTDVDFVALDNYLNKCEAAVKDLQAKKKAVDSKIIEENNKKLFKELGYDRFDEID